MTVIVGLFVIVATLTMATLVVCTPELLLWPERLDWLRKRVMVAAYFTAMVAVLFFMLSVGVYITLS